MAGPASLMPPRILGTAERARYADDPEIQAALAERDATREAAKLAIATAIKAEEQLVDLLRERETAEVAIIQEDTITSGRAELVSTTEGV